MSGIGMRWAALAGLAAAMAAGVALAATVNGYYVFVLANVALFAIVGIGLNVLLGLTGQMSFGHVGFYASAPTRSPSSRARLAGASGPPGPRAR